MRLRVKCSCSFQVTYSEFMQFLANATFGAYMTVFPNLVISCIISPVVPVVSRMALREHTPMRAMCVRCVLYVSSRKRILKAPI